MTALRRTRATSVKELEAAVSELSRQDLVRFAEWFEEYNAEEWDRQIEEDIRADRLDELGRKADEDFDAGRATPI